MKYLKTLHVAGNRIIGKLPDEVYSIGANITAINIAYNKIGGTLSSSLINRPFLEFDVSSNRITGFLGFRGNAIPKSNSTSFIAEVNRLSGIIPSSSINQFHTVKILSGNLIACGYSLPADPVQSSYRLESSSLRLVFSIHLYSSFVFIPLFFICLSFTTMYISNTFKILP